MQKKTLIFSTGKDEKAAQIYAGSWLWSSFPQAFIQLKVNNVRAHAIVYSVTMENRLITICIQAIEN